MKLEHEFTVPVPVGQAWEALLDVERIAPCMPGATLLSVDGRDFTGSVKVKVGPITVTYDGKATFDELDEAARRVVIAAIGRETRGAGTAAATVTATLVDEGASTSVRVETDLNVTGRPAQFGRGVMAEVGAKLVGQFAACLADELSGGGSGGTAAASSAPGSMSDLAAPGEPVDPAAVEAAEDAAAEDAAANDATEPPAKTAAPAKKAAAKKTTAAAKRTAATKTTAAAKKTAPANDAGPAEEAGAAKKTAAKKAAPAKKTAAADESEPPAKKAAAGPPPAPQSSAPPRPPRPPAEPIDLLDVAGGSIAKRVAPLAVAFVVLLLLLRRRRRRR
jgi:carbon monoxide dehydrogenase subunit G